MPKVISKAEMALCSANVGTQSWICGTSRSVCPWTISEGNPRHGSPRNLGPWLTYNLIRKVTAQAALRHEKLPRQLSFAAALDAVVASWDHASVANSDVLAALASRSST